MRRLLLAASFSLLAGAAIAGPLSYAQRVLPPARPPGRQVTPFLAVNAQRIALVHVRVIDGTGAPAMGDRTLLIDRGRIVSIGGPELPIPRGTKVLDLSGHSVLPGLVGMHDHLFYIARPDLTAAGHFEPPLLAPQMTFSAPRLYLAAGVTTLRTTGSVEPYTDINLKTQIDAGKFPGPHMDITAPYLEGRSNLFIQMHQLTGPNDARRTVDFWAKEGMTSFKAYMHITRAELGAAIQEAHRLGLKITGHLCAVTYPQAARLGIDDLEHGFFVNTELDPGKKPDQCTPGDGKATLAKMKAGGRAAQALIRLLVAHHVAVTSTLPVFATTPAGRPALSARERAVMTPQSIGDYAKLRALSMAASPKVRNAAYARFRNDMALEREFVAAGGLLLAGPDPTGAGNVIPGFGDQREVELLVAAGFSPLEAIRIATFNGATYLGLANRIGSIAPGKDADLIVVAGAPDRHIRDIENVDYVFKDGIGYDPSALLKSVAHTYGRY